jgi:hypothetical protein
MRAVPIAVVAAAGGAYAWWATGVAPFQTSSYVTVAIPALLVGAAAFVPRRVRRQSGDAPSTPGALVWAALLVAAAGLEAAGLALGGRSARIPTLSDVVDHVLRWHGERFVLFALWLVLGALIVRSARHRPESAS